MEGQNKTNEVIFSRKKHTFSKIIYFIFVGLWASIINIIVGIVLCCTLIFIIFFYFFIFFTSNYNVSNYKANNSQNYKNKGKNINFFYPP